MLFYRLALFIHVMGALTLFIAVGLNFVSMLRMRQARNTEQLADWARLGLLAGRMIPLAILCISGSAIYMVTVAWGWQTAWVDVVLATFIGHAIVVQAIENPRLSKLHKGAIKASAGRAARATSGSESAKTQFSQAAEPRERGAAEREWPNPVRPSGSGAALAEGPVPLDLHLLANDALLWTVDITVATTTVGMIFLMSVKPDLVTSLVAIGVTLLAGLALAVPFWQPNHARARLTQSGRIAS